MISSVNQPGVIVGEARRSVSPAPAIQERIWQIGDELLDGRVRQSVLEREQRSAGRLVRIRNRLGRRVDSVVGDVLTLPQPENR